MWHNVSRQKRAHEAFIMIDDERCKIINGLLTDKVQLINNKNAVYVSDEHRWEYNVTVDIKTVDV